MDDQANPLSMDFTPYTDFDAASRAVLHALNMLYPMGAWLMTRVEGDDWLILQSEDNRYGVETGDTLRWHDNYCSRMVKGLGPHITNTPQSVPVYSEAPVNEWLTINSYIGVPVTDANGALFGTLCAVDTVEKPELTDAALPVVQTMSRLLGSLLARERERDEQRRRADWAATQMHTDALTGLANRRAWMSAVGADAIRAGRYGDGIGIIMIDLDGLKIINDTEGHAAGDALIQRAAGLISRSADERALAARLGGDEFAILVEPATEALLEARAQTLRESLLHAGIAASLGYAMRSMKEDYETAIRNADKAMYVNKAERYQSGIVPDRRVRPGP